MYASFFVSYDTNSSIFLYYCLKIIVGVYQVSSWFTRYSGERYLPAQPYSQDQIAPHLVKARVERIELSLKSQAIAFTMRKAK